MNLHLPSLALSMSLASSVAAAGPAPVLWNDISAGMTDAEVRSKHPNVEPDQRGLVEKGVSLAGSTFSAYFVMNNGRVGTVRLQSLNANPQTIIDGLSAKYGAISSPYKCDVPGSPVNRCTAVWNGKDGVSITLATLNTPGMTMTTIEYAVAAASGL